MKRGRKIKRKGKGGVNRKGHFLLSERAHWVEGAECKKGKGGRRKRRRGPISQEYLPFQTECKGRGSHGEGGETGPRERRRQIGLQNSLPSGQGQKVFNGRKGVLLSYKRKKVRETEIPLVEFEKDAIFTRGRKVDGGQKGMLPHGKGGKRGL